MGREQEDRTSSGGHLAQGWLVTFTASLVYLVAVFHRMILGAHGSEASEILRLDALLLGLLPAASFFVYALAQVPVGLAADHVGPRPLLLLALATLSVGGCLFALTSHVWIAVIARILVGVGDACTFLSILRVAAAWLPASHFVLAAAMANAMGAGGQLLAAYPLAAAISAWGWSTALLGASALAFALVLPVGLLVRNGPSSPRSRLHWRNPLWASLRECIARPETRIGMWLHSALMGPFLLLTALWGVPYLVETQHFTPGEAVSVVSLSIACFALGSLAITLSGRRQPARFSAAMVFVVLSLASWTIVLAWPALTVPWWVNGLLFVTTGLAASGVNIAFGLARAGSPAQHTGLVLGLVNMASFAVSAAFLALVGVGLHVLSGVESSQSGLAFRLSFIIVPTFMALGVLRLSRLGSRVGKS